MYGHLIEYIQTQSQSDVTPATKVVSEMLFEIGFRSSDSDTSSFIKPSLTLLQDVAVGNRYMSYKKQYINAELITQEQIDRYHELFKADLLKKVFFRWLEVTFDLDIVLALELSRKERNSLKQSQVFLHNILKQYESIQQAKTEKLREKPNGLNLTFLGKKFSIKFSDVSNLFIRKPERYGQDSWRTEI